MSQPFGCVRNTIRLRSGRYFDLADPKPEQFTFADIAGALSKICRFGGQIEYFYSVAEHLYHCAQQALEDGLPDETVRAILMHDAPEAFIGDVVKSLKIMLSEYAPIEARIDAVIESKFGIDFLRAEIAVRKIDQEMLIAERRAFFSPDGVTWTGENDVRRIRPSFQKWNPVDAEHVFVRMAQRIGIEVRESVPR